VKDAMQWSRELVGRMTLYLLKFYLQINVKNPLVSDLIRI